MEKPKRVRPSRAKPKVVVEPEEPSASASASASASVPVVKKPTKPRAPAKRKVAATADRSNSDAPPTDATCTTELADTCPPPPPPNPREKFISFVSDRLGGGSSSSSSLTDIQIRDIEIGIFNWSLEKADLRRIPRNWNNPRFYNLYTSKARSIACNLIPDSYVGNERLTHRIKDEEFNPHDVVTMSADHVCPERWQTVVEAKIRHDQYMSTAKPTAMTDQFRCGRCSKRECSFMELQTRSCDEPASIFVCCLSCGFRWRMG